MKDEKKKGNNKVPSRWVKLPTTRNVVAYMKIDMESVHSTISVNDSSMTNSSVYYVKPAANFVSKNSNQKQAAHENLQANNCHHEVKASRGQQQQPEVSNSTYGERIFSFDEELRQEDSDREIAGMSKFFFYLIW